jgi:anti-anti-sigma regulatory factor
VSKKKPPRVAKPMRIDLGAHLSIVQAAELHRTLTAAVAGGGPLVIDGSCVETADTAILQLLVSLWRSSEAQGIDVKWLGASAELQRLAKLIGVAEMLHFDADLSARVHADATA